SRTRQGPELLRVLPRLRHVSPNLLGPRPVSQRGDGPLVVHPQREGPSRRGTEEVYHATEVRRRHALLSRSCPSDVEGILSETHVKRGRRVVHGDKGLHEKLGRNDPCPCGSGLLFKKCCRKSGCF